MKFIDNNRWGTLKESGAVDIRLPAIASKICHMDNREHHLFKTNNKQAP